MKLYAEVIINSEALEIDRPFTYKVPEEFNNEIKIGQIVKVPFGKGNKTSEGFILNLKNDDNIKFKTKNIAAILVKDPVIDEDDINLIETQFETSSVESKGKMIYIINHVENMTLEAINALLKFLEEPANNIYAFLTAENESRVLPTIVSRSQTLHFKSIDKQEMKKEAINLGVELKDAELLCNFYNNAELIKQKIDDKDYQNAKKSIDNTLDILSNNKNIAIPKLHSLVFPNVKSKEAARLYLDMLTIVFQDLVNLSIGSNMFLTSYEDNLKTLSKHLKQINNSLLLIMTSRGQIDMNINIGLLLDHIFQNILGDD